jgi:hypothetical protein
VDLKTFISESLEQIISGIRDVQSKAHGDHVAAEMWAATDGNLINGGNSGLFTRVDFDVAVTATTSGSGKAQVSVLGVELGGGGQHQVGRESRIKFAIPVRLPQGAKMENLTGPYSAETDFDVFGT